MSNPIPTDVERIATAIFRERAPGKRVVKRRLFDDEDLEVLSRNAGPDKEYEGDKDIPSEEEDTITIDADIDDEEDDEWDRPGKKRKSTEHIAQATPEEIADYLRTWKLIEPEICCICLETLTEREDPFIYCDGPGCEVCIHESCYGVPKEQLEKEEWWCERCLAPPEEVVECILCPSPYGAFKRIIDPVGGWVHIVCALWVPEALIGDPTQMTSISLAHIPSRYWHLTCHDCPDGKMRGIGVAVPCEAGGCKRAVHITCAHRIEGCLETIETSSDDEEAMAYPYLIYCRTHAPIDPPRLNLWWRWVLQRDRYLWDHGAPVRDSTQTISHPDPLTQCRREYVRMEGIIGEEEGPEEALHRAEASLSRELAREIQGKEREKKILVQGRRLLTRYIDSSSLPRSMARAARSTSGGGGKARWTDEALKRLLSSLSRLLPPYPSGEKESPPTSSPSENQG